MLAPYIFVWALSFQNVIHDKIFVIKKILGQEIYANYKIKI